MREKPLNNNCLKGESLRSKVRGTEKIFLSGRRSSEADLESAVRLFLEFLRGFETLVFPAPVLPYLVLPALEKITDIIRLPEILGHGSPGWDLHS